MRTRALSSVFIRIALTRYVRVLKKLVNFECLITVRVREFWNFMESSAHDKKEASEFRPKSEALSRSPEMVKFSELSFIE